jgi:hypothetical protein
VPDEVVVFAKTAFRRTAARGPLATPAVTPSGDDFPARRTLSFSHGPTRIDVVIAQGDHGHTVQVGPDQPDLVEVERRDGATVAAVPYAGGGWSFDAVTGETVRLWLRTRSGGDDSLRTEWFRV